MEEMDAEMAAVRQQAASQVAAAKKEAAVAREAAAAEAARNGAAHVASAVERETALSANLADLRAEYEVRTKAGFIPKCCSLPHRVMIWSLLLDV